MASQSHIRLKITLLMITVLVCLAVFGAVGRASHPAVKSDAGSSHSIVKPDSLKWGPFIGPSQMALVFGDPSQAGPFVVRIKSPAGTTIAAHWHPTDENLTVLEGKFAIGMGDVFDAGKLTIMEREDYIQMPAKMHHFAKAVTDTVVQVHGMGPFAVTFVNPADDPRPKQ